MIFTQEAPLTRKWFSGRSFIRSNWNKLGVNFEEGGNQSALGKPLKSGWDRLKLNPHTTFVVVEVEGVIDVQYASLTSQGVQHRVFYLELSKFRSWDSLVEGSLFLKPSVSLEDRRSNVSSSQRIFAFSVYTPSHTFSLSNSFDPVTNVLSA